MSRLSFDFFCDSFHLSFTFLFQHVIFFYIFLSVVHCTCATHFFYKIVCVSLRPCRPRVQLLPGEASGYFLALINSPFYYSLRVLRFTAQIIVDFGNMLTQTSLQLKGPVPVWECELGATHRVLECACPLLLAGCGDGGCRRWCGCRLHERCTCVRWG